MISPAYQGFQQENIPQRSYDDGKVNAIAGNWDGPEGPVNSVSAIQSATIELGRDGHITFPALQNNAVGLYIVKGKATVNGEPTKMHDLVTFEHKGESISIKADNSTVVLFISGEPLGEPVVRQGPYVMNTKREIFDAAQDYLAGKMGTMEQ